ncbi:unnamed protein product [Danaus chrysippus]|uniref:(African queen) hypothetical protein n=1 Tax=Danaus chrysippus TaxID=151541 RepID=A0A8J2QLZ2_9NEOP|nr:unnamed protein product [Danaus chrysippus]
MWFTKEHFNETDNLRTRITLRFGQLKEHQIGDHNPFEEVLPLCSTEHLINLPKNKARPPIKDVACHAISDTYEGVTLVIQREGLLCRECDTPLDSDKHFLLV